LKRVESAGGGGAERLTALCTQMLCVCRGWGGVEGRGVGWLQVLAASESKEAGERVGEVKPVRGGYEEAPKTKMRKTKAARDEVEEEEAQALQGFVVAVRLCAH
jgi:hypothetical protein